MINKLTAKVECTIKIKSEKYCAPDCRFLLLRDRAQCCLFGCKNLLSEWDDEGHFMLGKLRCPECLINFPKHT